MYNIYKQVEWYDHTKRMGAERMPRRVMEWFIPGRRGKNRSQKTRVIEIRKTFQGKKNY